MARRNDLRPAATDHLAALAARFHPKRAPAWDWETRTWWWIGPSGVREVLGSDWSSAHMALHRLGQQLTCAHGSALTGGPCEGCRSAIADQLSSRAA